MRIDHIGSKNKSHQTTTVIQRIFIFQKIFIGGGGCKRGRDRQKKNRRADVDRELTG